MGEYQTESYHQQQLFLWSQWVSGKWPELELMYHVPNEGKRSKAAGGRLKAEGLKAGVPDICLPVARGKYHGLYIELKSEKGRETEAQSWWLAALRRQGYAARVCHGWVEARECIEKYLEGGRDCGWDERIG